MVLELDSQREGNHGAHRAAGHLVLVDNQKEPEGHTVVGLGELHKPAAWEDMAEVLLGPRRQAD